MKEFRFTNPNIPTIRELTLEINRFVGEQERKKCLEHLKECNIGTRSSKLLATVKSLWNTEKIMIRNLYYLTA